VRALLGQNGAGKSTLIKILAGVYHADAGSVEYDGVNILSGHTASPIAFIHQDRGLVPGMTVAENIALTRGYAVGRLGLVSWRGVNRRAREVLDSLQLDIDPEADVAQLTLAERALVAIARAMSTRASFIVLDEPTAALPASVVDQLVDTIRRLRDEGVGFLYVTHRIDEVFPLADTVTVLRDGRVVMDSRVTEVTRRDLIRAIVGRNLISSGEARGRGSTGTAVLAVKGIGVAGVGPVTFQVCQGEIVGLVGLTGAGQSELGRAIVGVLQPTRGTMLVDGKPHAPKSAADALGDGIGLVAGDRLEESLAPELTTQENLYLNPAITHHHVLRPRSRRREAANALEAIKRFDVRPQEPAMPIGLLSGGNQQKVVIARWIEAGLRTLVLEEPTAGVDIGSKAQIHDVLLGMAKTGCALVIVSSDFDEVTALCDRVLVFSRGRVAAELADQQLQVKTLTGWATGAEDEDAVAPQHDEGPVT
jgi:ribose transport system ATP-binding protein